MLSQDSKISTFARILRKGKNYLSLMTKLIQERMDDNENVV